MSAVEWEVTTETATCRECELAFTYERRSTTAGPVRFSLPLAAPWRCDACAEAEGRAELVRQRSLVELERAARISESVPPRYQRARLTDLEAGARDYFAAWDGSTGLYLFGRPGSGKTHAVAALVRYAIETGRVDRVAWRNVPAFLEAIRSSFGSGPDRNQVVAASAPLLVLDDLGAEKPSDWVRERLYCVVNERYERELPTVVTSNLELDAVARSVGQRVARRLAETCQQIEVTGKGRT